MGNNLGGVMLNMLVSSAVDHGFKPRSGLTKDYKIGTCSFSSNKPAALRRTSQDWLALNQDNVSVGRHVYPWTVVSVS